MTQEELGGRTGTEPELVGRWAWGADAHDLVEIEDGRIRVPDDVAQLLLDANRSEYLGGLFQFAAVASLDYGIVPDIFRTGRPLPARPDRYRAAIERLTLQDIGVFFQEVLAALPQLVLDLAARVPHPGRPLRRRPLADRHGTPVPGHRPHRASSSSRIRSCGPGRTWRRPRWRTGSRSSRATSSRVGHAGEVELAYFQYALHVLPDPAEALRSAWSAVQPGGWLVALDWYLPVGPGGAPHEARRADRRHPAGRARRRQPAGDPLRGARLVHDAGLPMPELIDLPSGASAIVVRR